METQQWQVSSDILIFEKIFFDNRFINLGISWNCVESVFWRARDIPYLPLLQNVLILCHKNNTNEDSSYDIVPNVSISSETCLDWVSKKYSKLRNIAKLSNAAVVGITESELDNSVLSSEYSLIIIIHLCNFNYIISCVFFSIWLWWRAVSKYGTFFYESILIITGCACTRGIPGTNGEQHQIGNCKKRFTCDTEPLFYCFQ